eukprot:Opistho-2@22588
MTDNVKVAVRVRPFNSREKDRNAKVIIKMEGNNTYISDPNAPGEKPREFSFDFSYWSHDGFKERADGYLEAAQARYADQTKVFDDLGRGVLSNAWEGYNCSLFAYGQTGSGKSYSMVGYGTNKGIVPVVSEELFKGIDNHKGTPTQFQVTFSMLEIYNEQVRDLLQPKVEKGGMKVRENPKKGFYVENLTIVPVNSYAEIEKRIAEGTLNRTVAATQMNATSSRAHTIVSINFAQKNKNDQGQEMQKVSNINLVDLAGSERADSTGATGDRLKEGSAINQSLSTLGNVIAALADKSGGKKNVLVPYRDSMLTKLLKNALGGNSKTVMIAALSPADINFDETLSTLRFADRAKRIKTQAVINENPTEKLIRELKEENARLLAMLKGGAPPGGAPGGTLTEDDMERMRKQLEDEIRSQLHTNEQEMTDMSTVGFNERLKEAQLHAKAENDRDAKIAAEKKSTPHFWNLNEDPQLTAVVVHFARPGVTLLGNKSANPVPEIVLAGLSIMKEHAIITNTDNKVKIKVGTPNARILVNGEQITGEIALNDKDRLVFGSSHTFVFENPKAPNDKLKIEQVDWSFVQKEIARHSGFQLTEQDKAKEDMLLQEDLITLLPMVNEANAISEELNKKVFF